MGGFCRPWPLTMPLLFSWLTCFSLYSIAGSVAEGTPGLGLSTGSPLASWVSRCHLSEPELLCEKWGILAVSQGLMGMKYKISTSPKIVQKN